MSDIFGLGKFSENSLEAIKLIYPDLAKPGIRKVGQALGTVLDLCNTILLPLKLANTNANVFFNHHMEKYRKNMERVPEEEVAIVPPSIGLKILNELLMVTNEDISDLFINLLTNASTSSQVKHAHPSFIEAIKNLSEDEAKIIKEVYYKGNEVKYIYLAKVNEGVVPLSDKVNNVSTQVKLTFEENSLFYMENLIKLGILKDSNIYSPIEVHEFESLEVHLQDKKKRFENLLKEDQEKGENMHTQLDFQKGKYILNSYGKSFIESVTSKGL